MTTEKSFENVRKLLKKHNQSHLLAFWQQLNTAQRKNLLTQIDQLDFPKIDAWIADSVKTPASTASPANLAPPASYSYHPANSQQAHKYNQAGELAEKLISNGKVAALVVAGGQATRLGFEEPKGNLHISPVKNKTLFQIFAESIAAVSEKFNTTCPWYVMTSPLNYDQTKEIFRSNNYYGLDRKNVFIFQQGTLPNFSFDGKILLTDKDKISRSPDGHGGCLKALYQSNALADMKKRGVKFISYFQVDNPLINIFDPLFIGLHAIDDAEMSSKAVTKTRPQEKVGVFCLAHGRVTVIEYSNLPNELAEKRNHDGSLVFHLGSIAVHIINTAFVEKLNARGFSLPLHKALKIIPHVDQQGNHIEPTEPNAIKLESFVFDALPLASKSIILQTPRPEEFAPVKNITGPDTAEIARQMMVTRAANWLESAGAAVPRKPDGSPDCNIEIAPTFALEKNDIKAKLNQIPQIKPNDKLYLA